MFRVFFMGLLIPLAAGLAACVHDEPTGADTARSDVPKIIFDTDFGGDADDLGALAMLHDYLDKDLIDLLGVVSWSNEAYAVPALVAVNTFYDRPSIRLGVRETDPWRTEWNYSQAIAERFPYDPERVARAEPAVAMYRSLLAAADPGSVTIVTVGPLANILNLIRSQPDAHSALTGAQLIAEKVDRFVIMGGQFPEGITAHGPEWNFDGNMPGVTQSVLTAIDRPIIFVGYEVGEALKYGSALKDHDPNSPLYVGYKFFSQNAPWMKQDFEGEILDNSSFDQAAVVYAGIGGDDVYWTLSDPGILAVDEVGVGTWTEDPAGHHRYVILSDQAEETVAHIAAAMTHDPRQGR